MVFVVVHNIFMMIVTQMKSDEKSSVQFRSAQLERKIVISYRNSRTGLKYHNSVHSYRAGIGLRVFSFPFFFSSLQNQLHCTRHGAQKKVNAPGRKVHRIFDTAKRDTAHIAAFLRYRGWRFCTSAPPNRQTLAPESVWSYGMPVVTKRFHCMILQTL